MIVAGFVACCSGLLMIGTVLTLWFLGLISALMLMVSAFGGVMYLITGKAMMPTLPWCIWATRPFPSWCRLYSTYIEESGLMAGSEGTSSQGSAMSDWCRILGRVDGIPGMLF